MKKKMPVALTASQKMFVAEMVRGRSQREAAAAAGVSEVTVSRWRTTAPRVYEEISRLAVPNRIENERLIAENTDRAILEKYDVLKFLSNVVKEGDAKHVQLKASELLLKQYGLKTEEGEASEETVARLIKALQGAG